MATDTGRGTGKGAVKKRSQRQTKLLGQKRWTKRSRASGEFMSQKSPAPKNTKASGARPNDRDSFTMEKSYRVVGRGCL